MSKIATGQPISSSVSTLLTNIFTGLHGAKIKYCVERNYEHYPITVTGDVDILVDGSDISRAVLVTCEAAKRSNWVPFVIYETNQAAHLGFYAKTYPERFVLVIEYFVGGTWRGFSFLNAERVIGDRESYGVTWKPNSSHELIITLVHHLLYNGQVYSKYRESIIRLHSQDKAKFLVEISSVFGRKIGRKLNTLIERKDWDMLEKQSHSLRFSLVVRSILFSFSRTIKSFWGLVSRISNKPNGILVKVVDDKKNLSFFLESIIEVANGWHIFIPPKRQILNVDKSNFRQCRKNAKKIVRSGGVVIMSFITETDGRNFGIMEIGSIQPFEISEVDANIQLQHKGLSYNIARDRPEQMALVFWNIALNILSRQE